ncbi:MAG TPA: hypothetical protein VJ962_02415 [Clostridia bacterium]|nr:hypothetical protein [Clostridia bacterium]
MIDKRIIEWLLNSDVSIQYQVTLDLLKKEEVKLRERIDKEGWGAKLLSLQNNNGHWGNGFYQPKWTSTHYTLLDLKNLNIRSNIDSIQKILSKILHKNKAVDGGINPIGSVKESDVCINGMFLNYASYFNADKNGLKSVVDFIISQQLLDGGFNCRYNRKGATHSSLHSTISVIEGIHEYSKKGYNYRLDELLRIAIQAREFILMHHLFKSDKTDEVIDHRMTMLSYPSRWRYDILRALDYFQMVDHKYDERMNDALDLLIKKQRKDKKWPVQHRHIGASHFDMEKTGQPSRWNTLRALRVIHHFGFEDKIK